MRTTANQLETALKPYFPDLDLVGSLLVLSTHPGYPYITALSLPQESYSSPDSPFNLEEVRLSFCDGEQIYYFKTIPDYLQFIAALPVTT